MNHNLMNYKCSLDWSRSRAPGPSSGRRSADSPMAKARTCYGHLAGGLGVAVFDHLLAGRALPPPAAPDNAEIALGPGAASGFARLGVDVTAPLPPRRKPAT